jgi:uncharacterized protein YdhG (YjbR/CyaY superfamily)
MSFASVYLLYIAKAEKKGRTKAEVDECVRWLTGYTQRQLDAHIKKKTEFQGFFAQASRINPLRRLITGVVCGVRIEAIQEPLMKEIRYLDKLIDELAAGRAMQKILRSPSQSASAVLKPTAKKLAAAKPQSSKKKAHANLGVIDSQTRAYNKLQTSAHRALCDVLASEIGKCLPEANNRVWHAHPVWFLDENPIVGYSAQKVGIRLMFWSGADFGEAGLNVVGRKFKDASVLYNDAREVNLKDLRSWLRKSREIQWDYKNLIRRKGRLEKLSPSA